ncbi:MAG TPA: hypothetical protein VFD84_14840 [Candidatus Binatia bacterium]|nr:hypothetical protein [Candidatus Binatia bacterium]
MIVARGRALEGLHEETTAEFKEICNDAGAKWEARKPGEDAADARFTAMAPAHLSTTLLFQSRDDVRRATDVLERLSEPADALGRPPLCVLPGAGARSPG